MTDRPPLLCILLSCLTATVAGCGDGANAPADKPTADQTAAADSTTATTDSAPAANVADRSWETSEPEDKPAQKMADVELKIIGKADYQAVLAGHKGKVILVDFWGTWCPSCKEMFPHTVEMSRKYRDEGLQVLSVAHEYNEDLALPEARKFLSTNQATLIENYMSDNFEIDTPTSFDNFDVQGEGLPEYHLFDRDGKRIKVFSADDQEDPETKWSHEDVEAAVKEALAQPKGEAPAGE